MRNFLYIFLLLNWVSAECSPDTLILSVSNSEGGAVSNRKAQQLQEHLNAQGCPVSDIQNAQGESSESDLLFLPLHSDLIEGHSQLVKIKVLNNEALSSSVLVKESTGIDSLKALQGVHMAVLNSDSQLGYQLVKALFDQQDLKFESEHIIPNDTSIGAVSLLIHGDAFAAVLATPLANKWRGANNLKVVASSEAVVAGGVWIKNSLSNDIRNNCRKAFESLTMENRKTKSLLKTFPAWVVGFK